MELKPSLSGKIVIAPFRPFNRTTMELKQGRVRPSPKKKRTFNRTTMELKHGQWYRTDPNYVHLLIEPLWNWNESRGFSRTAFSPLLIEPLWNWNRSLSVSYGSETSLLIEPLWNWNVVGLQAFRFCARAFNRTTMELKLHCQQATGSINSTFNRTTMELKRG